MNMKPTRKNEAKSLFSAFSEAISHDEELANEILINNGSDPEQIERNGQELYQKYVLRKRLAHNSIQKTSLLQSLSEKVTNYLQEQSVTISSTFLPGQVGSQQQVFTMLCNKFKEISPEDLKSIMQDEAVLKELKKIQQPES
jgi:hypothetical protein